jgi:hypothetical protein
MRREEADEKMSVGTVAPLVRRSTREWVVSPSYTVRKSAFGSVLRKVK